MKTNFKDFGISRQILMVSIGLSIALVIFLLGFSTNQLVDSKNEVKNTAAQNRSAGVIEKIDRNFYERFGDVQAYAYNKLAIQVIDSGKVTVDAQNFINTMVSYYVLYDLMLIVDKYGTVVAVNTADKNGGPLSVASLIGADFSNEEWFRSCLSPAGPTGGAWYSDFMVNPYVAKIYGSNGWGMAFAAPIKNANGEVIGAWYNFASWKDVTQGIRMETEQLIRQEDPRTFILITDRNGLVIDADDESLVGNFQFDEKLFASGAAFQSNGKVIQSSDFITGFAVGKGAYTYKGNDWKAVCFVPKENFSLGFIFGELSLLTGFTVGLLLTGIFAFLMLAQNISKRITSLQNVIYQVSLGDLVEVKESSRNDEIAQMTNSVKTLADGLKRTSMFANEIGNGNLNVEHVPMSEKDVLGQSLVSMQENLKKVKAEDEKRKWVAQGLADFGDKLRANSDSVAQLCDVIVAFLCNYVSANQAAIFIEDVNFKNELELVACYAWNRKKYLSVKIDEDEGLISQTWREGGMIILTDVPDDFVRITSGLGEANPRCILLIALRNNDENLGVLEIASLRKFEEHEIEYIKRISESLAAALASSRINDRTRILLEQTQDQAQNLRAQEEELRQSMEELKATQEDMVRKEVEYLSIIKNYEAQTANVVVNEMSQ